MKSYFKKLNFIIILFFALSISAGAATFQTLNIDEISHSGALLRGQINLTSTEEFPLVWFQYGIDPHSLDRRTIEVIAVGGNYINSQFIYDLKPNTIYYYRTAMKFNGDIQFGQTLSFKTLGATEEASPSVVNYIDEQGNLTLEGMLQQYDAYERYDSKGDINTETTFVNGKTKKNDSPFSFSNFWDWIRGKNTSNSDAEIKDINIVHSEEEIKAFNEERKRKLEELSEQKRDNHSAAENDELGEIVKYNTHYQNNYSNNYKDNRNTSSGLNYSTLLIIVGILIALIIILRMFYLSFKKKPIVRRGDIEENNQSDRRYYIPVNRGKVVSNNITVDNNVRPNIQPEVKKQMDSGKTFFRRPPKK